MSNLYQTNNLYFVVGLPHSGKSHIVEQLKNTLSKYEHFEINMYENSTELNYYFSAEAYSRCKEQVELSLSSDIPNVIVSNPSIKLSDWKDYLELAQNYGYNFVIKMPGYNYLHIKTAFISKNDQEKMLKKSIKCNEEIFDQMVNEFQNIKKIYIENKKNNFNTDKWLNTIQNYI